MEITHLSFKERANYCLSPIAKKIFNLLDEKKTNLALSADVTKANELLKLADSLGPEICVLKTHMDIISDFTPALPIKLRELAQQHDFFLFEDRKFADIGHTVKQQYGGGIYRIADWADIINAHSLPGPGVIQGLADVGRKKNRAILLIAELSAKNNLIDAAYVQHTLKMAERFADFVIGFITQHALSKDPHWMNFTPGVKLEVGFDTLGQQYITPEQAIVERGSDVIIVGRGIISEPDPIKAAKQYRDAAWQGYIKRCQL